MAYKVYCFNSKKKPVAKLYGTDAKVKTIAQGANNIWEDTDKLSVPLAQNIESDETSLHC